MSHRYQDPIVLGIARPGRRNKGIARAIREVKRIEAEIRAEEPRPRHEVLLSVISRNPGRYSRIVGSRLGGDLIRIDLQ